MVQVGAVIVSPTRELASQIYHVLEPFLPTLPGIRAMLLVGGTDVTAEVAKLKQIGANFSHWYPWANVRYHGASFCLGLQKPRGTYHFYALGSLSGQDL